MATILQVVKHSVVTTVTRRSFLLSTFGVPALVFLFYAVVFCLRGSSTGLVDQFLGSADSVGPRGLVDHSGLIAVMPDTVPRELLLPLPDEAAAQQALERGEIDAYYVIPSDYIERGEVVYVRPGQALMAELNQNDLLERVLLLNLLQGDTRLATRVEQPLVLEQVSLESEPVRNQADFGTYLAPYVLAAFLGIILNVTASGSFESMAAESENRVLEIVTTSTTLGRLFAGKIIGQGITGLLLAGVWILSGYGLAWLGGDGLTLVPAIQLTGPVLFWALVYFCLGYALYASLMTGLGALMANLRHVSLLTLLITAPLQFGALLSAFLVSDPNNSLATFLSLFPLTCPMMMVTRLALTHQVPAWQPPLAAAILVLTTLLVAWLMIRLFRLQMWLVGQPFRPLRWVRLFASRV